MSRALRTGLLGTTLAGLAILCCLLAPPDANAQAECHAHADSHSYAHADCDSHCDTDANAYSG